jgi:hypothetical protein
LHNQFSKQRLIRQAAISIGVQESQTARSSPCSGEVEWPRKTCGSAEASSDLRSMGREARSSAADLGTDRLPSVRARETGPLSMHPGGSQYAPRPNAARDRLEWLAFCASPHPQEIRIAYIKCCLVVA